MATKKKPLRKAQKGIYKGDPGFTITPDSATIKKALKSDPGFTITPKGKVPKSKISKDGYVQYKKGGSTKVKKYEDGGPTTLGKTLTRSVKIKKSGEEKEISDRRYDRIKNRMSNRAGTTGMSSQETEDGITTTTEAFKSKSGRKAIGRRTVTYKKGGSIKSKNK